MKSIVECFAICLVLIGQFLLVARADGLFSDEYVAIGMFDEVQAHYQQLPLPYTLQRLTTHPRDIREGRFMPLLRPLQYLQYLAFDDNFVARHWFECFLWIVTALALYAMARRMCRSPGAGLLAGLFLAMAWPLGMMVVRVHNTETIFVTLQLLAYLCIWHGEEHARRGSRIEQVRAMFLVCAALALVATSMLFKETALAVVAGMGTLGFLGLLFRPSRVCMVYLATLVGSIIVGVAMIGILVNTRKDTGYSSDYDVTDLAVLLKQVLVWRNVCLSAFGPLFVFAVTSCLVRAAIELRHFTLSQKSLWRLTMLAQVVGFVGFHAPWPSVAARYAFPGLAILGLLIACESADLWRWSRIQLEKRPIQPQKARILVGFGTACALWYLVPPTSVPIDWSMSALKIVTLVGVLLLWRRIKIQRPGSIDHSLARLTQFGIAFSLALFVCISVPCRYNQIEQGKNIAYAKHRELFEIVDEYAPEDGRVIIGFDLRDWCTNFNAYRNRNFERRDYVFVPQSTNPNQLKPEDLLIEQILDAQHGRKYQPGFDTAGRIRLETHALVTPISGPYYLHEPLWRLILEGWLDESGNLVMRPWPIVGPTLDYGWHIYLPEGVTETDPG